MPTFLKSIVVEAPVDTVFGFHEREDALRLLSPRFPPLRVIRKTGGIKPGSRVELKIGPFLWTALHTAYEKNLCSARIRCVAKQPPFQGDIRDAARQEPALT